MVSATTLQYTSVDVGHNLGILSINLIPKDDIVEVFMPH
jgi:hypothetical protein